MSNTALIIEGYGGRDVAKLASIPEPEPATGTVVVEVKAAGINGLDWKIREGLMKDGLPLSFPAVLGLELAGQIVAVAPGAKFAVGDRVMGLAPGFLGAYAQRVAVPEEQLISIPDEMSDRVAGGLPVTALTAWQMLHAAGEPVRGQKILVHGASGGVGTLLVQLALREGMEVVATASPASHGYLENLGVNRIVDRTQVRFEDEISDMDLVFDLAGGDVPQRSWSVLRAGGTLVSATRPDVATPRGDKKTGIFLMMQPQIKVLSLIATEVAMGKLRFAIAETVPLSQLAEAIERNRSGHAPGKMVADFTL